MDSSNISQAVNTTLDTLSKRFGATGTHLWGAYLRYVLVEALTATVAGIITGVVGYFIIKNMPESWKEMEPLITITGVTLIIIGAIMTASNLPTVLAPEGYAIYNLVASH